MILMTNYLLAPVCIPSVMDKSLSSVVLELSSWLPSCLNPTVPHKLLPRMVTGSEAPRRAPLPIPSRDLSPAVVAVSLSLSLLKKKYFPRLCLHPLS